MRFLLFSCLLFGSYCDGATINASVMWHYRGLTQGALVQGAQLAGSITTNIDDLKYEGTNSGTFERIYVTNYSGPSFPWTVRVDGTNYTGAETNALAYIADTNVIGHAMGPEYIAMIFKGGQSASLTNYVGSYGPRTNVIVCSMIYYAVTNPTAGNLNFDSRQIHGSGTVLPQIRPQYQTNVVRLVAHGTLNGSTAVGATSVFAPLGRWLCVVSYSDVVEGYARFKVYDPSDGSFIGEDGLPADTLQTYEYAGVWETTDGVGYIGDCPGYWINGPTFVIYNATDADYAALSYATVIPFASRVVGKSSLVGKALLR